MGRRRFADLLTVGGKLYHETHFAPLLRMQGEVSGIALELVTSGGGGRLPVLVTSAVKTGPDGQPLLIRTTVFDARDRRAYEQELLRARQEAEPRTRIGDRERLQTPRLQRSPAAARAAGQYPDWRSPRTTTPPPPTRSAATSTTCSRLDRERWGLFLGDVCGKGADAAAVTSLARYTLRAAAVHDPDPVSGPGHPQHGAQPGVAAARTHASAPCSFGVLTPAQRRVPRDPGQRRPPPRPAAAAERRRRLPAHPRRACSSASCPTPRFTDTTVRLAAGDTLLLYTDGLTEARTGTTDGRFEEEALLAFTTAIAPTTAPAAVAAVTTLLAELGPGLDDDVAVLAISVPSRRPTERAEPVGTADA